MSERQIVFTPSFSMMPSFPVHTLPREELRNGILVRTPNWLGDLMMALPAMKQLKAMLPEHCGLMVLAPKSFVPVLKALPGVADEIFPIEDPHAFLPKGLRKKLCNCNPGACVLFNNSLRDVLSLKYLFPLVPFFGAAARFRSIFLKRAFSFGPRRDGQLNPPHQAMRLLAMVNAVGAPEWDGAMPDFHTACTKELFCEKFGFVPQDLLILSPGAAYGGAKRWEPEHFRFLGRWWIDRGGTLAAVGTGKEAEACGNALKGLPEDRVWNLAGRTNLDELLYVIQHASFCIANDSGVMHMAAALGIPGVAIFGSTDMAATAPLSRKWKIVYVKEACSPCFRRQCPKGTTQCMKNITPCHVIGAAESLLADNDVVLG